MRHEALLAAGHVVWDLIGWAVEALKRIWNTMITVLSEVSEAFSTADCTSGVEVVDIHGLAIDVVGLTSSAVTHIGWAVLDSDTDTVFNGEVGHLSGPTVFRVVDSTSSIGQNFITFTITFMSNLIIGREWWAFAVSGLTSPVFSGVISTFTSAGHWVSNGSVWTSGDTNFFLSSGVSTHTDVHASVGI